MNFILSLMAIYGLIILILAFVKEMPKILLFILLIPLIPFSAFIKAHKVRKEFPRRAKLLVILNVFILLIFIGVGFFFYNI